jgi:hypothetical protein
MSNNFHSSFIFTVSLFALTVSGCTKDHSSLDKGAQTLAEAEFSARVRQGMVPNDSVQKEAYVNAYEKCMTETLADLKEYNHTLYEISIQARIDGSFSGGQPSPKTLERYTDLLSGLNAEDAANIKEADRRFQTFASYCSDGRQIPFRWYMDPTKGLLKPAKTS